MKKLAVKILLSFFLFVLLPTMVLAMQNGQSDVNAQTNSNTQSQSGQQNSVKNSTTSDDDSTSDSATTQQNRNENQINNPETGEMTQERIRLEIEECQPAYVPDNATSSVRKKMVEETIDSLIQLSYSIENSDTGTQIRAIAKAQGEAENKANQAIDDSKRSAVGQLFLGPKYQQLREAKQVMEQNRVRVQELQKIMAQISNQADKTQLQTQINTLEIQNIALENQLESETNKFSFLGWLFSLIYQY